MAKLFDFVPQRAVSLVPSITESMFQLGMGNRLVGRTDYCIYPEGHVDRVPTVGGTQNPDIEAILALNPDLILMNREENRKEDFEVFKAAGLEVWASEPRTVREAFNVLWDLMDTFEVPNHSDVVRQIERAYDYTELAMRHEEREPILVFAPIWKDPWMTANEDTYISDLISVVGGHNIFAERERLIPLRADLDETDPYPDDDPRVADRDRRYPRVTLDEIVQKQPQVVLLPSEPYAFSEADAEFFYTLDIPAAKQGHIFLVDGSLLTWHGTRLSKALQTFPPIFSAVREAMEGSQNDA